MSFQVDTALVNSYRNNFDMEYQQTGSRLRRYARNEMQHSEVDFYDRVGATAAVRVTTRHGDTPLISTPHNRRRCTLEDWDWGELIDKKDLLRMLGDPQSVYVRSGVSAIARAQDQAIINAAFGTSYGGDKTAATPIAFPAAQTVGVTDTDFTTGATSNLTVAKLRKARRLLEVEEVTLEDGWDAVCVVSPACKQALLADPKFGSADYNAMKPLVDGRTDNFLGFKFVVSNMLPVSGNVRDCLVFHRDALVFASAQEIVIDIGPRRDKRNSIQLYVSASFGATRLWEEGVVKIRASEATDVA